MYNKSKKRGGTVSDVSIVSCAEYSQSSCENALEEVLAPLGGLLWVKEGMRIVIKANLVSAMKPGLAATTHPALLSALVRMLKARGAHVTLGDSPGGLFTAAFVGRVYKQSGMHEVEAVGAELNQDFSQKVAQFPAAKAAREFAYTAYLDKADAIINFCKLKSHGMMSLSAAAKNMFGAVPGTVKPEYHFRFPNAMDFAHMIVDLNEYFKPRLCIVDAVVGMEGNGPTAGTPRQIGAVLAGENPHKVDLLCAKLIALNPAQVPTLTAAIERGLAPESVEDLSIAGDFESLLVPDFVRIESGQSTQFSSILPGVFGKIVGKVGRRALSSVPKLRRKECVGCGVCKNICPAKAIAIKKRIAVIDRKSCIRCFCCQEFCPKGAMKVKRPLPARILS
jgi:uncharacterized protein (DUF362 family)/NAD-dependent dihydropyrimidine dehydrogenase PreA subunit